MRVVSFNILDGGEGRADPLAEVLIAQRPDIVALVEADNQSVVDRLASRLDMEAIRVDGRRHGGAVLSRWPIVESVNHSLLHTRLSDCLLEAKVREPSGREWHLGVVHLHPRATLEDDLRRQEEIVILLGVFAAAHHRGEPHILLGDFNADSPVQIIDPEKCKVATRKVWHTNGGRLPTGAVEKLLEAGYVDTLHALHPSEAARSGSFSTQYPGQRVDYIFAFGLSGEFKSAWIEHDRLARHASDHFPVGLEVT